MTMAGVKKEEACHLMMTCRETDGATAPAQADSPCHPYLLNHKVAFEMAAPVGWGRDSPGLSWMATCWGHRQRG